MLADIDWRAPWLTPYQAIGQELANAVMAHTATHAALNALLAARPDIACPVRFVAQEDAQGAAAYESFIWQTKTVPTRDNLHDFFNGLVWLHFPHIKARLNQLHAAAIAASGVTSHRGRLRDALTLFDENAAFLIEPNPSTPLLQAVQKRAWSDAFLARRADWGSARVIIFGHALLEKLVAPRIAMTAHLFCPPAPALAGQSVDTHFAAQLSTEHLASKPFAPLPVMGVPNWCAENNDAVFYDNTGVFRA